MKKVFVGLLVGVVLLGMGFLGVELVAFATTSGGTLMTRGSACAPNFQFYLNDYQHGSYEQGETIELNLVSLDKVYYFVYLTGPCGSKRLVYPQGAPLLDPDVINISGLPLGSYTIEVKACRYPDCSGCCSSSRQAQFVIVEKAPPACYVITPSSFCCPKPPLVEQRMCYRHPCYPHPCHLPWLLLLLVLAH